ncbi:unnamed protein product [Psylliodes chrysocephalus]|uniref:Uncharacterized protein n=1 Tax=Psylliodes chrysocephalus TaxID=3402493 RepID=A0A9P0DBA4_9CUCU|nr:unnamed protein product [Psylliodes chrysocephala]
MKDKSQDLFTEWYNRFMESSTLTKFDTTILNVDDALDKTKICNALSNGANIILDISWGKQEEAEPIFSNIGIPYYKIDVAITAHLDLLDQYLDIRNASDVTMIFDDPCVSFF